ncbi:MAG: alpha/beta hydrolase fold domain-containing protein [Pirellulaceae bacterium]|nr:alpha/beta hydrolase fold domain-containing protein [Pirellulaceae bacterium]
MRNLFLVFLTLLPSLAWAQRSNYPPEFDDARAEKYKTVGDVDLKLWVFEPADHQPTDKRAAIVFFFGGGWKAGSPAQFEQHCRYLASRGMVAITADYRVRSRHETLADRCVADGKSAIRWVRRNAKRLGIDPNRIVAGGGSAGGHVAACTAVIKSLDEPTEDNSISSVPNAMALFNPALVLSQYRDLDLDESKLADIATRTGVPAEQLSPIHQITTKIPPTIIFHGEADTTVPFSTAQAFTNAANNHNSHCKLNGFAGQAHGFFNYGRNGKPGENFRKTINQLDQFLVSLGYLTGDATIATTNSPNAHLRSDLNNSRIKFQRDKRGSVAFIGGSITEMDGYRPMVTEYLQQRFPETEFTFTAAGISSTCSTTGAFRLDHDVLSTNPDLFFVEFAVNDDQDASHNARDCVRGMEGILRHALRHNPQMDIVVTHFVNPGMLQKIQDGDEPISSAQHERVATHYGVATNYLARELADRIEGGTMTWKEFGGTHPKKPGNRLAADMVIDILDSAWSQPLADNAKPTTHSLPKPIDPNSYTHGRLVPIDQAKKINGWQIRQPDWKSLPGGKRERFTNQRLLCATQPGSTFTLDFTGTAVGAYVLAGPDAGILDFSIDDSPYQRIDLYHRFSKGLHYPRTVLFDADLKSGKHLLKVRLSEDHNEASGGTAARILQLVVNGPKSPD